MNLKAERTLNQGKYVLSTQLGAGVFSLTYKATDTESGQSVVIKTIGEALRQHPNVNQFKQEFLDIAKRLNYCQHPHLVRVLDYFEDTGYPYLVMEYIPGQTLADVLQAGSLPEAEAINYIRQISDAVKVLHQVELLHRDIQPKNIIRRQDSDRVVLCEVGMLYEFTPGVQQTYASFLSAGYAPPEENTLTPTATPQTDIYALTATFYCLLTGSPPLPAPVRQALLAKEKDRLFPSSSQPASSNLSSPIQQAVKSGLELIPNNRPQTIDTWLKQLPLQESVAIPEPIIPQPVKTQPHSKPYPRKSPKLKTLPSKVTKGQHSKSCPRAKGRSNTQNPVLERREGTRLKTARTKASIPLQALFMTGAIAASAGIGFGCAVRLNQPGEPGSTILHTQQTFPPRSDWPVSESQL
ncbi:protein kinase domain [Coleofasciculus chthonoplastes PCC 7420]|uniref:Protein kinase domain n=1 Tax=Coleofasciculus chthonoplastes PCC 7420 TaxID=118168 RepID=B4VUI4_9CYAN|nr:serine/threonine-protein kinase [Coleofasciculus chthonoplastes]EDX74425.1 protein kinase domain [Coleofasciculus chthonoplastes PCC 7420]